MTVTDVLKQLEALGLDQVRAQNRRHGAGDNQYGVKRGDLRTVADSLRPDRDFALALWQTGNIDAQLLATLLIKPKSLTAKELEVLIQSITFVYVADWVNANLLRKHPGKEELRQTWMESASERWTARLGWSLTADRIAKEPIGLDLPGLLDRIESEMLQADPVVQWTMNNTLAEIGIHTPKLRKRALALGEKLGMYRDYPVPKGCTSPFAPIWIQAMVARQG